MSQPVDKQPEFYCTSKSGSRVMLSTLSSDGAGRKEGLGAWGGWYYPATSLFSVLRRGMLHLQRKCSFTPKKRRVIKKRTYIVIFSFPRFQHFCLSQTELLSNTALHEFKIKTLTFAPDFGLQDRSRQSPTERQIRDWDHVRSVVIISNKLRNRKHVPCFYRALV